MDNQQQGRDGQPLADHILPRPDVDPFCLQRASLVNGLSNLTGTVDGISSRLDILSDQVSSQHKQVNFEHNSQTVEIDLDPDSIRYHLRDLVHNWNSRKTQLCFESESILKILESMIINNYSGKALSHVLGRACEGLAASWSSWSFVRKSSNAAKLQSLAFPVDSPRAEPAYQFYRQGQNGRKIIRRKRVVKYPKSKNLLNRNLVLESKELNSFLSVTQNIDALRDSKSLGEST